MDIPGGPLTLAGVFLMGLGLNLTPCVYPMMSVTVSLFGGRKHHHLAAFLHAAIYVLGICFTYSVLGAVAALTGGMFGALLQSRWVLLAISLILAALALSMFGLYTFQAPAFVLNKAKAVHPHGLLKYFVSGLFVGIFAAPCIGPPILALLTFVGTRGDPWFAFWIFFVLSLGLGLPYLILGTFSGLLHRLPKSGVWLVWIERLFGVLLLVLAGFYLILALNPAWLKWLLPASLVFAGLYLGFLERDGDQYPVFRRLKRIGGVLAIAAGLTLPFSGPKETMVWASYAPEMLAEAKTGQRPVILDFYADWCIPCHELDQFTYSDKSVILALDGFTRLKVDLTRPDSPEAKQTIERFDILGLPTIVFLDPAGEEIKEARVTGFIPPEDMLLILNSPRLQRDLSEKNEQKDILFHPELSEGSELIGKSAEPWEVRDWLHSEPLKLADLKGKVLLVRFWTAPGCPFCAASAPALNEFYEKYHDQGLEVIGFYHHKSAEPLSVEDVEVYAKEFGFQFPIAIDYDWKTLRNWWIDGHEKGWTSVSFLIDKEGIIRHIHPGGQYLKGDRDYIQLEARIQQLLEESP